MASTISRAEAWETVYQAFSQINFTAFDYYTIKQSLVEYIKVYFPESFNDFIESSDLIAIIETFAYIGEQLIYRVDVGSHENFMSVAQRKQSVLRLAKLISYKASRNLPARGLLKMTSVQTSQDIYDSRGNSLKGRKIVWNDVNNSMWREQFVAVINAAALTNFGTVAPSDRIQVDNVLFELYSLNNRYTRNGVLQYGVNVNGSSYDMEVVPAALNDNGPVEKRPEYNSAMTFLYATDGFGDNSPSTGFFVQTKQGRLQSIRTTFDGKTPNQFYDIGTKNINDIDFWINNVDPDTDAILDDGSVSTARSGEWFEVDTTSAQNVIFSYETNRNRYELETLEDDKVRVIFGDGEFAAIPNGTYDIWYRTSANEDLTIPLNAVVDQEFSMTYYDKTGIVQTLKISCSLIANIQNASASEDIEHIRKNAPSVYYTQNRMVSGADYNLFFTKSPTILKVKAINRTYVGDSKYSYWHDASSTYENVKIFGNDMLVLFEDVSTASRAGGDINTDTLFTNYIVPVLSTTELYNYMVAHKVNLVRRAFSDAEATQIKNVLRNNAWPDIVYITYEADIDLWKATTVPPDSYVIRVVATMNGGSITGWTVTSVGYTLTVQSPTTKFWDANDSALLSYETLSTDRDKVIILQANTNKYGTGLIADNIELLVDGLVLDDAGNADITKLAVQAYDAVNSNLTGSDLVQQLIDPVFTVTPAQEAPTTITLPFTYVRGVNELTITGMLDTFWEEDPAVAVGAVANKIQINAIIPNAIHVYKNSFVYYTRLDAASAWEYAPYTTALAQGYALEQIGDVADVDRKYKRVRGRDNLNFLWMHRTPMYHLVDPSMTNIHDVFVIQKGYYNDFRAWIAGDADQPSVPTALQLRSDYSDLLVNRMMSDTVVFHHGKLKLIFGDKSIPQLQAKLLVIKNPHSALTDSQIKIKVRDVVRDYFDIDNWDFGQTFYFTKLATAIHAQLPSDIQTVVMVPLYPNDYFGDLFQVNISEDEIVQADINVEDIEITTSLNQINLRQLQ